MGKTWKDQHKWERKKREREGDGPKRERPPRRGRWTDELDDTDDTELDDAEDE